MARRDSQDRRKSYRERKAEENREDQDFAEVDSAEEDQYLPRQTGIFRRKARPQRAVARQVEEQEDDPYFADEDDTEEEFDDEYEDEEYDDDEYEDDDEYDEDEDESASRRGSRRSATKAAKFRGDIKSPLSLKFAMVVGTMVVLLMIGLGVVSSMLATSTMEDEIVKKGVNTLRSLNIYLRQPLAEIYNPSGKTDEKSAQATKKKIANEIKQLLSYGDSKIESEIKDIVISRRSDVGVSPELAQKGKKAAQQEESVAVASGGEKLTLSRGTALEPVRMLIGSEVVKLEDIELSRDWLLNSRPVYVFENKLDDKDGTYLASVRLFLSPEKIMDAKNRLYLYVGLSVVVAGILGVLISMKLASWVTRPLGALVEDIEVVSKGDLEHKTVPRSTDEIGLLARRFNEMTRKLMKAQKAELMRKMEQHELDLASKIQKSLLPKALPKVAGYEIFAFYKSAKDVGGDYYDFILADKEHLGFLVADVSGKGIPGSLVMSVTRSLIRLVARNKPSPAESLKIVNTFLARDIPQGMFVTCCYVVLNPVTRSITVCNAGHNPLLIYRHATKTVEKVRPPGLALGIQGPMFAKIAQEQTVQLEHGDRVVLYTDGVVESMNPADEQWGDPKFEQFIATYATRSSEEFVDLLVKALEKHQGSAEQHDDITIATFRVS